MSNQVDVEVRAVWDINGVPHVHLNVEDRAVSMDTAVARQLAAMLLNAADDLDAVQ